MVLSVFSLLHQFGREIQLVNHILLTLPVCILPFQCPDVSTLMPLLFSDWLLFFFDWLLYFGIFPLPGIQAFIHIANFYKLSLSLVRKQQSIPFCPPAFLSPF